MSHRISRDYVRKLHLAFYEPLVLIRPPVERAENCVFTTLATPLVFFCRYFVLKSSIVNIVAELNTTHSVVLTQVIYSGIEYWVGCSLLICELVFNKHSTFRTLTLTKSKYDLRASFSAQHIFVVFSWIRIVFGYDRKVSQSKRSVHFSKHMFLFSPKDTRLLNGFSKNSIAGSSLRLLQNRIFHRDNCFFYK